MPKIKDLQYRLGEDSHHVQVNCNQKGLFSIIVPEFIRNALNSVVKIESLSLDAVQSEFLALVKRFVDSTTTQELYIFIDHKATGYYCMGLDGIAFMTESRFSSFKERDALMFEFKVVMKETIDSVVNWFEGRKGSTYDHWEKEYEKPNEYFKGSHIRDTDWKKIPYSDVAWNTLLGAREKLRSASEILYNFISKDEIEIESILTNQKLLQ